MQKKLTEFVGANLLPKFLTKSMCCAIWSRSIYLSFFHLNNKNLLWKNFMFIMVSKSVLDSPESIYCLNCFALFFPTSSKKFVFNKKLHSLILCFVKNIQSLLSDSSKIKSLSDLYWFLILIHSSQWIISSQTIKKIDLLMCWKWLPRNERDFFSRFALILIKKQNVDETESFVLDFEWTCRTIFV